MSSGPRKKLLLVEDEALIALAEKNTLEKHGYAVLTAASGEHAIRAVEANPDIDLILMDINLGGGTDGTEAASRILDKVDVPLVFLSSHTEREVVEKTRGITSYGYIVKNSGETVLLASIDMAFKLFEAKLRIQSQRMDIEAAYEEMQVANEELIQSQQELLDREKDLQAEQVFKEAVFDSLPGYLYVYDDHGDLVRWNKQHETMTGYSAEELSRMNMKDWFEGEDAVRVAAAVEEVFRTGHGEVDANLLLKGGGKMLIHSTGVRLTLGGKTYFTGVGIDITERRKAEEELLEREAQIRRTTETLRRNESILLKTQEIAHVGTWELDLVENNLTWSDEVYRIVGLKPQSIPATYDGFIRMIHPDDRALVDNAYRESVRDGDENYEIDHRVIRDDSGETRHVRERCIHVRNETGDIIRSIGMVQDIMEHKAAQDRITALLEEKELLLRETHHRIKNNMGTIGSLLSLQADSIEDEATKAILLDAARRVRSMMSLYDTLYRSERYGETGLDEFLVPLVTEILNEFPAGPSIRADLRIERVALPPEMLSTIGIIVNELITNSMKYAFPAGGVDGSGSGGSIRLTSARSGSALRIAYGDDGPGLPEGVDFDHSTGFGLRLVGMLIQQIGGSVIIDRSGGMNVVIEVGL